MDIEPAGCASSLDSGAVRAVLGILYLGMYVESLARPQQVWWLNIWNGSLGGNGFSAFGATVLAITLTSEVIFMVFSLGAYLRQKERADRALEEAKKAAEEARKALSLKKPLLKNLKRR